MNTKIFETRDNLTVYNFVDWHSHAAVSDNNNTNTQVVSDKSITKKTLYHHRYYAANRDKIIKKATDRRKENPEQNRDYMRNYQRKKRDGEREALGIDKKKEGRPRLPDMSVSIEKDKRLEIKPKFSTSDQDIDTLVEKTKKIQIKRISKAQIRADEN